MSVSTSAVEQQDSNSTKPKKQPMSGSAKMLWALVLGVVTGLFFGEMVAWMSVIGNAVILLMQMTVYPYIVVSLVGGIGRLTKNDALMLFKKSGVIMLTLWLVGMVVVFAMPLVFPQVESASFFSTSSITEPTPIDYYKLYIPSNPFESMATGSVPAMVLFCMCMGLALIGMEDKKQIVDFMDIAAQGLSRVTQGLMKVLPYGIYAMSSSAAGTMGVDEFASMQVYLIAMFVLCMLLTFWVLPWLIAVLTPVPFKDVVRISRAGLVTAFATGNVFIVLPVIIEECKTVLAEKDALNDDARSMIDILVPIAYSFPNIGKLTVMLFVLFAGWFAGKPVDLASMPTLAFSGFLSLFGSVYVAIHFMLDLVHLPADLFQFFVMSGFITGKVSSMVAVMNLFALTLISITLYQGFLKYGLFSLIRVAVGVVGVSLIVLVGTRLSLSYLIDSNKETSEVIANLRVIGSVPQQLSRKFPVDGVTEQLPLADIQEIKKRGVLRVGYRPSNVPFSYYNNAGNLVGFDVEMAVKLAEDLEVAVEFIPFKRGTVSSSLDKGYFDIAMSGLLMNAEVMQRVNFTTPVMELTRSLVVPDYRVKEFDSLEEIIESEPIVVAYVEDNRLAKKARKLLPHLNFKQISNYKRFFKQKPGTYDALLVSAEAGSAWTLFYPEYGVAVFNKRSKYPAAYAIAKDNAGLLRYVDNWVKLQKVNGQIDKTYSYWILGEGTKVVGKRWSFLNDVIIKGFNNAK